MPRILDDDTDRKFDKEFDRKFDKRFKKEFDRDRDWDMDHDVDHDRDHDVDEDRVRDAAERAAERAREAAERSRENALRTRQNIERAQREMQVRQEEMQRRARELAVRSATARTPMAYGYGVGGGLATARATVPGETVTLVGSGEMRIAGLRLTMVRDELVSYFGPESRDGLLVLEASDDWDGVRAGDVILRADGRAVTSPAGVQRGVEHADGRRVALDVLRKRERRTVTLRW
jgi:hypothetical protein